MTRDQEPANIRFGISSIFWFTGTIGVLLVYRRCIPPEQLGWGCGIIMVAAFTGWGLGSFLGRGPEIAFWAWLGSATAFLCAVGAPRTHASFEYAWPLAGALSAATAVLLDRWQLGVRMCLGGLVALSTLACCSQLPNATPVAGVWLEVGCAPLAGAIMVGVVWVLDTLRNWQHASRACQIFLLTMGVVGGNLVGRWLGVL